uniref:Uncharacterized protein n=1 Tax=Pythium oligandrum TaxID=41045 RepID=Q35557_PYTOL|nr:unknown [Pythium oligandrum]
MKILLIRIYFIININYLNCVNPPEILTIINIEELLLIFLNNNLNLNSRPYEPLIIAIRNFSIEKGFIFLIENCNSYFTLIRNK